MTSEQGAFRLLALPPELLHAIAEFLDPGSKVSLTLCNKALKEFFGTLSWQSLRRMRFHDFTMEQLLEIGRRDHKRTGGWIDRVSNYNPTGDIGSRWTFLRGLARDSAGKLYFCADCEILHLASTREQVLDWVLQNSTSLIVGCPERFPAVILTPLMIMLACARQLCTSKYTAFHRDPAHHIANPGDFDRKLDFHQHIRVNFEMRTPGYALIELRFNYTVTTRENPHNQVDLMRLNAPQSTASLSTDTSNTAGSANEPTPESHVDALLKHIFSPNAGFQVCIHYNTSPESQACIEQYIRSRLLDPSTRHRGDHFECEACKTRLQVWKDITSITFQISTFLTANQTRYTSTEIERSFWGTSRSLEEIEVDEGSMRALLGRVCPATRAPRPDSHHFDWFHVQRN